MFGSTVIRAIVVGAFHPQITPNRLAAFGFRDDVVNVHTISLMNLAFRFHHTPRFVPLGASLLNRRGTIV